jgi:class 3 adenylate cyclase
MAVESWWRRLRRVPAPVVDAALAAALAVAILTSMRVAAPQGREPDALADALGLAIAGLTLLRRRWPLVVLVGSAALLQCYNLFPYPGLFPAVPLSVALATAWAAGHRLAALLVTVLFLGAPIGFVIYVVSTGAEVEVQPLVDGILRDAAMFAAVLLLGEAVRSRRALAGEHRLLEAEQERSERLLLNVLPAPIAERLKQDQEVIADGLADVSVLFADLVDFTVQSQRSSPDQVVRFLNDLFTTFDKLADRYGLEKIKTVGDAYMVAGGLPDPRPGHAEAVAEMALAMREEVAGRLDPGGRPLGVRIGIDVGPVVAGVIGRHKFIYDLWGDTVNTASRMESHGVTGCIQVTDRTHERLKGAYRFERRGPIQVKGKGEMVTWFLVARQGQPG